MTVSIEGRRIIVTGAAGGIGAGVLKGFARSGARLGAIYNRNAPAKEISKLASWRRCDLSDRDAVAACFEALAEELGGLDALINIAGLWEASGPPEDIGEEHIDFVLAANLKSAIFTNQAAFRLMKERGGRIVNFGSIEGVEGNASNAIYSAAKSALHGWTRSAAKAWGQHGVTVNCVAPAMHTPPYETIRKSLNDEQLAWLDQSLAERIPIGGKLGDSEKDCTPMLEFLASEGSGFVTGQVLAVDGGMRMMGA